MRSPEGYEYWLQGVYRELVAPEKIAFTHAWLRPDGSPGPETLVTILLKSTENGTDLVFRQTGLPSEEARAGHEADWNSTFDRLGAFLANYFFSVRD